MNVVAPGAWSGRLLAASALLWGMLLCCWQPAPCRGAQEHAAAAPVPPELIDAIKSLKKTTGVDDRLKIYDLLAAKGDGRLVPALKAYKDGLLLLRDGQLATFGERESVQDQSLLPLIDVLSGAKILGPDGKPIYFPKPVLTDAIRAPRLLSEKNAVVDVIARLSLLDPDPVVRLATIRGCAERAAQAMPNADDSGQLLATLATQTPTLEARLHKGASPADAAALQALLNLIAAAKAEHPQSLVEPAPSEATADRIKAAARACQPAFAGPQEDATSAALGACMNAVTAYDNRLDLQKKVLDDLPRTAAALKDQLAKDPNGPFSAALHESIASIDLVIAPSAQTRLAAARELGNIATSRAANLLDKIVQAAGQAGDKELHDAALSALSSANGYQTRVHVIENTFAGLSAGSILVLLALGLSIIFGLMGVINMAQGEFMMVGAFTTYVVAESFKQFGPGAYDYYLLAAVPLAFIVSAFFGFMAEWLVIRHLYARPLETLLATWGIGQLLIWGARREFGDSVSIAPPRWMEGGWEVAPDIVFPLNRVYIILFCLICIAVVYFVVNGTKLGLLLRATTQNRSMAAALGVATRRVDGFTFAFGAGLAGLAGVAVPLYNKINPGVGQEYTVDCFIVVVVGGVGKLAGAIWAGLGLGFLTKYLEPLLGSVGSLASGASVIGKVLVLLMVIAFLQWRPQGLFPPKGRSADA